MSHLRLARISLILAAIGLNAVPLLFGSAAHADTPPPAAKPAPDTVRPEIFKLIDPTVFKELMSAKKYPELAEKLKAAEAFPDKSPYETFIIERMRLPLASASGDAATAKKALQFLIDSGRLSDADRIDFIQAMGSYLYNERDYKNAITWFKRHQTESGDPSKTRSSLIRAYYLVDDNLSTKAELQLLFDSLEKQGKTPEQEDLRLFASAATKLKDNPGYLLAMEKLVTYYPSDDFWNGVLSRMQSKPSFNQRLRLDVYRLMSTAMTVMQAEDYVEMAELSLSGWQRNAQLFVYRISAQLIVADPEPPNIGK